MNTFKSMSAMVALVLGMASTSPTLAVTDTGIFPQRLGNALVAVDVFAFKCPYGTVGAQARVRDLNRQLNPAALMDLTLSKNFRTVKVTDNLAPPTGDDGNVAQGGLPSILAVLFEGPGAYKMDFSKTGIGIEEYRGEDITCRLNNGQTFDPLLIRTQNQ